MTNKILSELLRNPYEFLRIAKSKIKEKIFFRDVPTKEEVLDGIKDSQFRELFSKLTDDEIYEIYQKFETEIGIIKNWILNSNIRAKSFYYLGDQGTATASEIAKIISKHPKGVSTYMSEFKDKMWVEEPVKVGRTQRYSLSDLGLSFYKVALSKNWFSEIIKEETPIEETIIRVVYYELKPEMYLHEPKPEREPDFTEYGEEYYYESDPPDIWPTPNLISQILNIIKVIRKKLDLEINLPKISVLLQNDSIAVNSTDEEKLALIFAAFNYIEKGSSRTNELWHISRIKLITADSYFNPNMPDVSDDEGFMTKEETNAYIKKVLANFNDKLKRGTVE